MKSTRITILGYIVILTAAIFSAAPAFAAKLKAHIVPHTHWDREWGFTEEQHMIRCIHLIDNLIEIMEKDDRYRSFLLDGQSSMAEDYMNMRPGHMDRLRLLVEEGRIFVGPYYTQPDEFLSSGESLVRNIMIGMRIADEAGGSMDVAYEADNFGHQGQVPQILRGFGMDSIVFYRGIYEGHPLDKTGFRWRAPDGSEVVVGNMTGGYGAFNWSVPVDELAMTETMGIYSKLMNKNVSEHVLFPAGSDAREAVAQLPLVIDRLNRTVPQFSMRFSTLPNYMKYLKKSAGDMDVHEGDIRGHNLLACISTNMPLKIANHEAFTTLEKYAEPFSALMRFSEGREYPANFIDRAWKYILLSLPHDSVTGTSIELANEDIMVRFKRARRISEMLTISALKTLYEGIDIEKDDPLKKPVAVYNPHSWPVTGPVETMFPVADSDNDPGKRFQKGEMADYVVEDLDGNRAPSWTDIPAGGRARSVHRIRFIASDVPPMGYKTYIFRAVPEPQAKDDLEAGPRSIQNEFLKLTFNDNGTFDLLDRRTGEKYPALHHFEDRYKPGSPWSYSPGSDGPLRTSKDAKAALELIENNDTVKSVKVTLDWDIPGNRGGEETVPCGITSVVSLYTGVPRVDIYTEIDNRAVNHRMRAAFPTDITTDTVSVDSQFGVMDRDVDTPNTVERPGHHIPTYPQLQFVDLAGREGRSLAVFNRGLPEYEARRDEGGMTLLLTLIRAVGNYTPELRASIPEPRFETPAPRYSAQVQGINRAYYSIYPHAGGWLEAGTHRRAAEFNARLWPEAVMLRDVDKWMRGTLGAPQWYEYRRGDRPPEMSFISIDPPAMTLSALKKAETDDALILRVFNAAGEPCRAEIRFFAPLDGVTPVDLRERPLEEDAPDIELTSGGADESGGSRISFDAGPYEIVTLKLDAEMSELKKIWHNIRY